MMQRCYNKKHPAYKSYGNKNVFVNSRWHELNNFIEDVDKIEGFDVDKILNGELYLDKDTIERNNKEYCLEKCSFITIQESNKLKPSQQKPFIATSPNGEEYVAYSQSEFAKKHNLSQNKISMCLKGKNKTHKKWSFRYR